LYDVFYVLLFLTIPTKTTLTQTLQVTFGVTFSKGDLKSDLNPKGSSYEAI